LHPGASADSVQLALPSVDTSAMPPMQVQRVAVQLATVEQLNDQWQRQEWVVGLGQRGARDGLLCHHRHNKERAADQNTLQHLSSALLVSIF
jgi:hypothetical protein